MKELASVKMAHDVMLLWALAHVHQGTQELYAIKLVPLDFSEITVRRSVNADATDIAIQFPADACKMQNVHRVKPDEAV